jgi:CDP-2,3-bis-(O-geranylgeranyl)-sn-glycerol synthase
MAPILFKWVPFFGKPIHEKKLGSHKTWRGLIIGTLVGTLVFALQKYAYAKGFTSLALIDYSGFPILLGTFLGFGALLGDSFKSYYKRKMGIEPGKPWIPWDQIDFVIGGLILGMFFYVPPASVALLLLIVSPLLHLLANYLGYLLRINKNKL